MAENPKPSKGAIDNTVATRKAEAKEIVDRITSHIDSASFSTKCLLHEVERNVLDGRSNAGLYILVCVSLMVTCLHWAAYCRSDGIDEFAAAWRSDIDIAFRAAARADTQKSPTLVDLADIPNVGESGFVEQYHKLKILVDSMESRMEERLVADTTVVEIQLDADAPESSNSQEIGDIAALAYARRLEDVKEIGELIEELKSLLVQLNGEDGSVSLREGLASTFSEVIEDAERQARRQVVERSMDYKFSINQIVSVPPINAYSDSRRTGVIQARYPRFLGNTEDPEIFEVAIPEYSVLIYNTDTGTDVFRYCESQLAPTIER